MKLESTELEPDSRQHSLSERNPTLGDAVAARQRVDSARRSFQEYCRWCKRTGLWILGAVALLVCLAAPWRYGLGLFWGVVASAPLMAAGVLVGLEHARRVLRAERQLRESVRLLARTDAREVIMSLGKPVSQEDREVLKVAMEALNHPRREVVPTSPPPGDESELTAASDAPGLATPR